MISKPPSTPPEIKPICTEAPRVDEFHAKEVEFFPVHDVSGRIILGLTVQSYENAALNDAGKLKAIRQLKAQRDYYKDCALKFHAEEEKKKEKHWWQIFSSTNSGNTD